MEKGWLYLEDDGNGVLVVLNSIVLEVSSSLTISSGVDEVEIRLAI